jgi:hypothetical protein
MSTNELRRVGVLARVASSKLKLIDAAVILRLSYRQAKRLWRRYREEGAEGLKHRSAGRESNRKKPKQFRDRVLRLVRQKYSGEEDKRFGPTLAAEHLASEDHLTVNAETLRQWMLAEGLWSPARKRRAHRKRRERKEHFGELVQLDGSFEDWLEERGPRGCLMNMVDDASSQAEACLGKEETTWAAVGVLQSWIQKHGVPLALYTDWKTVYLRAPTASEELRGVVPVTQFGRICKQLGIRIIGASSPQAKGRVERSHGTHQDRLIKKMRLRGIRDYAAANRFLQTTYLPEHNRRFARLPAKAEDYHRAIGKRELEAALHLETEHVIDHQWVVRHSNRYFQLRRETRYYAPAKANVTVCEWEDGRLEIRYRGRAVRWEEIAAPAPAATRSKKSGRNKPIVPAADHPWRRDFRKVRSWRSPVPPLAFSVAAPSASP